MSIKAQALRTGAALVLDDDSFVAADFAESLRELGFAQVSVAHDVESASAAFRQERPAVALLDVNLGGGGTSIDFALELAGLGVQVFFTSGYGLMDLPPIVARFPFIEKPTSSAGLGDIFRGHLNQT